MRMSRTITLTLVSAAMLTACVTSSAGCRRNRADSGTPYSRTTDRAWYDAGGNKIAENWKTDETGKRVPDPHPRDRDGKLWATDADGNLIAPTHAVTSSTTTHRSGSGGLWLFGGSNYRGSGPTTHSSSSPSSSVRSGGFGSSGASISGGS